MKIPETLFNFGDTVYHRVRPEIAGQIIGICLRPNGLTYSVVWSNNLEEKWHFESELTTEKGYHS